MERGQRGVHGSNVLLSAVAVFKQKDVSAAKILALVKLRNQDPAINKTASSISWVAGLHGVVAQKDAVMVSELDNKSVGALIKDLWMLLSVEEISMTCSNRKHAMMEHAIYWALGNHGLPVMSNAATVNSKESGSV